MFNKPQLPPIDFNAVRNPQLASQRGATPANHQIEVVMPMSDVTS